MRPPLGGRVFISALGIAQICSWGSPYYAFPLIAEQIERETGWTRTSLYGAASVGLLQKDLTQGRRRLVWTDRFHVDGMAGSAFLFRHVTARLDQDGIELVFRPASYRSLGFRLDA